MSTITPCLWFDGNAEDAAKLYTSLLPERRINLLCAAVSSNQRLQP
jgi:predicted 3-demethylubiquinone-9 3-methyltransferase (glyoxalase superfamily)